MCGLAGFLDDNPRRSNGELTSIASRMADALIHRGPDGSGVWVDEEAGIGLSHRRLSIVDLSEAGSQPMISSCSRYVIIYNGEVYNSDELRADLPGVDFRGHSDTEVILEGIARWGVEHTVKRLIGMFAFVLWDRESRHVFLVRDRLGIKPLYWSRCKNSLLFGSELKALWQHPAFDHEIDRGALAAYTRHNYVPGPRSIFRSVKKLPPGCILIVKPGQEPRELKYWTMEDVARSGLMERTVVSDEDAVGQLDGLLGDAVKRRMVADVPLGAFLSGGIDSSTVAALMQAQSDRPIRTFSIGFHESGYNEAKHAAAVAHHLATEHTELYVTSEQARDVIPRLPDMFDEPFADSSQIPTFLVSELARRDVTVALSGDGGDELFAGYNRYTFTSDLWQKISVAPKPARRLLAATIRGLSPRAWDQLFAILPQKLRRAQAGDKLYKLASVMAGGADELYRGLVSQWDQPDSLVIDAHEPDSVLSDPKLKYWLNDQIERMQYLDTITYLPDDILTKVDRASMAASLEARVPILDHRVVEFAWKLPMQYKIRNGTSKWVLRQVLERYVPSKLFEREKMGFGVPIDAWLRGPLRDWAEDLLDERRLRDQGYFHPEPIRQRWQEHLSGTRNFQYPIWTILMFQAWIARRGY